MRNLPLALALCLASALGYAIGAVTQQRLATRINRPLGWLTATRYRVWWAAVGLNAVAAALHVAALRYGPLMLVQPLGALTLVMALPMGAALAGRQVTSSEWRGAAATVLGLAGTVLLTAPSRASEALSWDEVIGVTVVTGLITFILVLWGVSATSRGARGILYAAASGVAFGISSALTQTITVVVDDSGLGAAVANLATVAVAVLVTLAMLLGQAAYRYGLSAPLATSTIANPIAATIVGVAMLDEHFSPGLTGTVLVCCCAGLAGYGITVLSGCAPRQHPQASGVSVLLVRQHGRSPAPPKLVSRPAPGRAESLSRRRRPSTQVLARLHRRRAEWQANRVSR